jgi:hypothetical protein
MIRNFYRSASAPNGEPDFVMMFARIALTLLFGGLVVLGWRLLAQDHPRVKIPLRRRALLNVEDAVRWRPEF